MDDAPFIDTVFHVPDTAEWRPLEAVARLSRSSDAIPSIDEDDFMYMGYVENREQRLPIHLYKHIDTRRYLNLDDGGHAYRYWGPFDDDDLAVDDDDSGGLYGLCRTLGDALHVVVDDLEWMRS